jgi:hypothetical protein
MRVDVRFVLLSALFIVVVGIIGLIFLSAVPQTFLGGSFTTSSSCSAYVRDYWCTEGYACKACYLSGGFYSSDCFLSGSSKDSLIASGNDFCKSSVVSHNGYWCYDNDVYYFNSAGVREDKKTECGSNGCTSIYSGASTKVGCNVVSIPTPVSSAKCMNDAMLCVGTPTYTVEGGDRYMSACSDYRLCSGGSVCREVNGVGSCEKLSCQNTCTQGVFSSCVSDTRSKSCVLGSDGCWVWKTTDCSTEFPTCKDGRCVKVIAPTVPTAPTPTPACAPLNSVVCVNDSALSTCSSGGKLLFSNCGAGEVCSVDKCVPNDSPVLNLSPEDKCLGVICADECAGSSFESNGVCTDGVCSYADVSVNDARCTNAITGAVTGSTFIDKWGLLLGGALLAILVVLLFTVGKPKRRKK